MHGLDAELGGADGTSSRSATETEALGAISKTLKWYPRVVPTTVFAPISYEIRAKKKALLCRTFLE
jgi:hypothetical protein